MTFTMILVHFYIMDMPGLMTARVVAVAITKVPITRKTSKMHLVTTTLLSSWTPITVRILTLVWRKFIDRLRKPL